MTDHQGPEDQLTRTLNARAESYADHGGEHLELYSVLARAGEIRRGRRMRASIVMAAAVLAVAVPVGITALDGGPDKPAPIATSPTPTPTPTPTHPNALSQLPLGPRPDHSYVELGVLHNTDGSTRRLPGNTYLRLSGITPYLGGYLIGNGDAETVTLLDGNNKVVKTGPGSANFVTTPDGVETAYVMNGTLYSNPGSGMASGDGRVGPVAFGGQPVGYLQQGLLYETGKTTASGAPQLAVTGGGSVGHDLDSLTMLNATDETNDRVAGTTADGQGRVISVKTHRVLWTSQIWQPIAFDLTGKYVSAIDQGPQGPRMKIAILDAATGRVVASADLGSRGLYFSGGSFDDSGNLLAIAQEQDTGNVAMLRLSPAGRLDRATRVIRGLMQSDNETPLVIPAGPQ